MSTIKEMRYARPLLAATTALVLLTGTTPIAYGQEASSSVSPTVMSHAKTETPATLPVRDLAEVRAEANEQGLDSESTELAVELQRVINAYHSLPTYLKSLPLNSPEVQRALTLRTSAPYNFSLSRSATIDIGAASACAKAVASTLIKRGTLIGQFWTLLEVVGGVVQFAQGMGEILKGATQENFERRVAARFGKEMGFLLGRVIGYTEIVLACKDLRI